MEVNNSLVHKPMVSSGFAFSAKRWVATMARECERFAAVMTKTNSSTIDGGKQLII